LKKSLSTFLDKFKFSVSMIA